ncbi:MAG: hypothetical protein K2N16_09395 [Muribaculaceae bacterium]|nr:hypothetical protein [Muribaculaceae bacterium]
MKKLLLILATLLPMLAAADNYFVDGTSWTMKVHSYDPNIKPNHSLSRTHIDGDTIIDGVKALKAYSGRTLAAIIRTDGDKVYALSYKGTGNTWHLAYDFSLKAGDVCEIGWCNAYCQPNSPGQKYYVKCTSVEPNPQYCGWPTIYFEMFDDPECSEAEYMGAGQWLVGIGNIVDPLDNFITDEYDGCTTQILCVEHNGQMLCQHSEAAPGLATQYFTQGTEWTSMVKDYINTASTSAGTLMHVKIDGDTIVDGTRALKAYQLDDYTGNESLVAIIWPIGDIVYTLNTGKYNRWLPAYNFSLKEGESYDIYSFDAFLTEGELPEMRYFVCTSISSSEEYGGWPLMTFDMYTSLGRRETDKCGSTYWLAGLGSIYGLERNWWSDEYSEWNGSLLSVKKDGEVICQHVTASLGNEVAATALSVSVDGLSANVTGAEPGCEVRAYAADGSLAASATAASDGRTALTLPHPGLYMIATPSASAKVFVR